MRAGIARSPATSASRSAAASMPPRRSTMRGSRWREASLDSLDPFKEPITMLFRILSIAVLTLCCSMATPAWSQTTLKVSAIPDEAPTELQRKFAPLGRYLEQRVGMQVQFIPVSDYAAVVQSLATGRIDLAWLGGFTFVQAKDATRGAVIPIVQREEDQQFTSKFVTTDPAIQSLADLRGKTFAFGSPASTSGHLMPRYFLLQAGIRPERDFRNVVYSSAHDAT